MSSKPPISPDFDPYYRWLGIPRGQRPPNHYRLLGISPTEDDREAIEAAVQRQTILVKTQKEAEHEQIATRVLYEIQEAGSVILDQYRRKQYDEFLEQSKPLAKQRSIPEPFPPYTPSPSVGEGNEIVRTYFGVMSIILGGFIIMAVVSFMLPWRKVVFGIQDKKVLVETEEAEAEQETVRQPVVAPRPVAKIMGGSHGEITNSTGMKRVLVSAGSEKSSDAQALPTTESQRAFEESLPGKYRLELRQRREWKKREWHG
jgi:curved DNA-binding protein CbpA